MTHTHQDAQQKLPVAEILFTGFTIIITDGVNITSRPLSGTDVFLLCGYAAETALCVWFAFRHSQRTTHPNNFIRALIFMAIMAVSCWASNITRLLAIIATLVYIAYVLRYGK